MCRERERETYTIHVYVCVYIYIYIYICFFCLSPRPPNGAAPVAADDARVCGEGPVVAANGKAL